MTGPRNVRDADVEALARTLYGEARGESLDGKIAVAHVILNRWRNPGWWSRAEGVPDHTIEAVCRAPWQFSAWNEGDPNREKMLAVDLSDKAFRQCMHVACGAIDRLLRDPFRGTATHYFANYIDPPDWADVTKRVGAVGVHDFYALGKD